MLLLLGALGAYLCAEGKIWFNMPSLRRYPVRGVDVSHYQGEIDWETLSAQNIRFAFIKATEGSGTVDECFAENWKNARASGLSVGAYHFFSFDSPAASQAANFCACVPCEADALPPVIDLEHYRSGDLPAPETVRENLREMLETLRTVYGKTPIIYTTRNCWELYLQDSGLDYTLWIRSVFTPPASDYEPAWTFWQYNPRGKMDGYSGSETYIDLNLYRGSEADFRAAFG